MRYGIPIGLLLVLLASLAAWWRPPVPHRDAQQFPTGQTVGTEVQNASEEAHARHQVAAPGLRSATAGDASATPLRGADANGPSGAQAQVALGDSYLTGSGVKPDPEKAAYWYRQAADQGDVTAQLRLGQLYEQGTGVAQDLDEAFHWYGMAADQGDAAAQANVGDLYEFGPGIRSNKAAVYYYRLAAAQGYREAQADLGRMYELGKGVAPDPAQAFLWYSRAADQRDALAAKSRDRMRRQLSPAQLGEAD